MISLIERGMSSPTAAVLDKLAVSLGVTLPALFAQEKQADASPVSRRSDQQTWRDPATGYVRRNLSPSAFDSPIDLVEVTMPPLARVAYDSVARHGELHQQIWVLEGAIEVTVGHAAHRLSQGDCLAMVLDGPIVFRNSGKKESRHLVALMRPTRNSGYR
jgi:transcriptional regulator with XRE-family HTH domain